MTAMTSAGAALTASAGASARARLAPGAARRRARSCARRGDRVDRASGSGKSTPPQIAGLLEHPDGGEVYLGGRRLRPPSDAERTGSGARAGLRRPVPSPAVGVQRARDVMLLRMPAGHSQRGARAGARAPTALGVERRGSHRPARQSGGEQQRVAIAAHGRPPAPAARRRADRQPRRGDRERGLRDPAPRPRAIPLQRSWGRPTTPARARAPRRRRASRTSRSSRPALGPVLCFAGAAQKAASAAPARETARAGRAAPRRQDPHGAVRSTRIAGWADDRAEALPDVADRLHRAARRGQPVEAEGAERERRAGATRRPPGTSSGPRRHRPQAAGRRRALRSTRHEAALDMLAMTISSTRKRRS